MPRRSPHARIFLAGLLALQVGLPGAVAWADARLDASSALAVAHFDSHTTESCVHIHPADCAFDRFLSAPFAPGKAAAVSIRVTAPRAVWRSSPHVSFTASQERLPDSRAPPQLS
jgi:hypothetical protein